MAFYITMEGYEDAPFRIERKDNNPNSSPYDNKIWVRLEKKQMAPFLQRLKKQKTTETPFLDYSYISYQCRKRMKHGKQGPLKHMSRDILLQFNDTVKRKYLTETQAQKRISHTWLVHYGQAVGLSQIKKKTRTGQANYIAGFIRSFLVG